LHFIAFSLKFFPCMVSELTTFNWKIRINYLCPIDQFHRVRLMYEQRTGIAVKFDSRDPHQVAEHQSQFSPFPVIGNGEKNVPRYDSTDYGATVSQIMHGVIEPKITILTKLLLDRKIELTEDQLAYFIGLRISLRTLLTKNVGGSVQGKVHLAGRQNRREMIREINHLFVKLDFFTVNRLTRAQRNVLIDNDAMTGWNQDLDNLRESHACLFSLSQ